MARILYGVMGNTWGHISRALAVAEALPEHEFYFVGGGRVPGLVGGRFPVLEVPVARTVYKRNRAVVAATCRELARCAAAVPRVCRQILELVQRWQPSLAICDREFFLPRAARRAGLPCVWLGHSHILRHCRYRVPPSQWGAWALGAIEDRLCFHHRDRHLLVSFYRLPLARADRAELFPPLLRQAVRSVCARAGDHVLMYQSTATFPQLVEAARQLRRPVVVYGVRNEHARRGNVTFKPFHQQAILEDLAGCAYAVANGGHNFICEALYFGKPLVCVPVGMNFEQYLNGRHVRALGYGDFCTGGVPTPQWFRRFESRLEEFRHNIAKRFVDGTGEVLSRLRQIIGTP
jgi:uncharacterized protein (TIGR00661 family)